MIRSTLLTHRQIYENLVKVLKDGFIKCGISEDKASRLANIQAVKETRILFNLQRNKI